MAPRTSALERKPAGQSPARVPAARRSAGRHPVVDLHAAIGNDAVSGLLRDGVIGNPDGRLEREARAGTPPRPAAATSRAAALSAAVRRVSPGAELPTALRRAQSRRLGLDLDGVRIHTDPAAQRLAAGLDADAFTTGRDVVFGRSTYRPETSAGRVLITHELIHVAQQAAGIAPPIQRQEAAPPAAEPVAEPEKLDNIRLMEEAERTRAWLEGHSETLTEHARRKEHLQRLNHERGRRVLGGHVWMIQDGIPGAVYQLVPSGPDRVIVARLEAAELAGLPAQLSSGRLLSDRQFEAMLAEQGIHTVPAPPLEPTPPPMASFPEPVQDPFTPGMKAAATMGTAPSATPWARGAGGQFARQFNNPQHLRTGLVGGLAEVSLGTRTMVGGYGLLPIIDLNAVHGPSTPVMDVQTTLLQENVYSVKASAQATESARVSYNLKTGGPDVTLSGTPHRQALFSQAAQTLFPGETPAAAQAMALEQARLAVNPEDVEATARRLGNRLVSDPADFQVEINRQLARNPAQLEPGGQRFTTLAAIDAEVAARPQLAAAYQALVAEWAAGAGAKVVGHGTSAPEFRNAVAARGQVGFTATTPQIESAFSPELVQAQMRGGGARGNIAATGGPAVFGAGTGGLVAGLWGTKVLIMDKQGTVVDVLEQTALGTGTGALGGATSQVATSVANRALVSSLGGPAAAATGRLGGAALMSRGIGGGAGSALAAPLFVMGHMGYQELSGQARYAGHQYAAKGGRAAVVGGASGFFATVGTAALIGAPAGPVGIIVGAVIGLIIGAAVYYLLDDAVGQDIESGLTGLFGPKSVVDGD